MSVIVSVVRNAAQILNWDSIEPIDYFGERLYHLPPVALQQHQTTDAFFTFSAKFELHERSYRGDRGGLQVIMLAVITFRIMNFYVTNVKFIKNSNDRLFVECFFIIQKDPHRGFLVYNHSLKPLQLRHIGKRNSIHRTVFTLGKGFDIYMALRTDLFEFLIFCTN